MTQTFIEFSPFFLRKVLFRRCSSKFLCIFSSIPLSLRPLLACVMEVYLFHLLSVGFLLHWKNLSDKPLSLSALSNHQTEVFCRGFSQALATSGWHLPLYLGSNWIKLPRLRWRFSVADRLLRYKRWLFPETVLQVSNCSGKSLKSLPSYQNFTTYWETIKQTKVNNKSLPSSKAAAHFAEILVKLRLSITPK